MALMEAIASAKTRIEDLKGKVQENRTKNSEYAEFFSQHPLVNESTKQKDEIQEAISWYNTGFGFHVEGRDGVKFTFKNINVASPKTEISFTIHYENGVYTLLNCEPSLKGTEKLIHELNKTNRLYRVVRVMRREFQEAVTQDLSISSFRSDSPIKKNGNRVQLSEGDRSFKKRTLKRGAMSAALFPRSASSVRQSPRLKELNA